jgi:hypothetical protein
VINKSDKRVVGEAPVRPLTAFLDSERGGKATTCQQSALANSRARVREFLSAGEYDEAVFRAFRAGFAIEGRHASNGKSFRLDGDADQQIELFEMAGIRNPAHQRKSLYATAANTK